MVVVTQKIDEFIQMYSIVPLTSSWCLDKPLKIKYVYVSKLFFDLLP